MTKAELIMEIAEQAEITKKDASAALNAFVSVVSRELAKGESIQLVGFGTFMTSQRSARTGKNPQTGEALEIPAATVPKFKAGKALKDAVNK